MSEKTFAAAAKRSAGLRQRLKRYKLVFVQCGAPFLPIRDALIADLNATVVRAADLGLTVGDDQEDRVGPLVITEMEAFAATGEVNGSTIGMLRARVDAELDRGTEVCLVSKVPRIAYARVPGSSLLEDASVFCIPLLEVAECADENVGLAGASIPAIGLGSEADLDGVVRDAVKELGLNLLATLDHAIFETEDRRKFLDFLDAREIEALRGAGLIIVENGHARFVVPERLGEFSNAVADVLASAVAAQPDLAAVSEGLWFIERTIRAHLRRKAISTFGAKWRKQILFGDLPEKVLERARADVYITATSVAQLRDPIEWLSLGELLAIVRSSTFSGLEFDELAWRKFAQEIVPLRNRLSHMRLVRKSDRETVAMWAARIRSKFPPSLMQPTPGRLSRAAVGAPRHPGIIRGGDFCKQAEEGWLGLDAQGETWICQDVNGDGRPHWVSNG